MYINFWYPVILSDELCGAPAKLRMLGQDFVVFRDEAGGAHCLSNTCVHRGGSLAGGRVTEDCIECPYHGWRFDGDGRCHRIPSLGKNAKIPARARVDAYPVQERYGIVFAFLGDLPRDERPPILEIPEFDDEGWRATSMNYEASFDYKRSIENGLDPAHNEFVHPLHGFSGENTEYRVNDLRMLENEWGPGFFHLYNSPAAPDKKWAEMKKADKQREAGSGTIGPSHMWTYIRFGPGKEMHQYLYECPIDEANTRIFFINMRSTFLEDELDQQVNARNWEVINQDITVLNDVHPTITPRTNAKEFMLPADGCVVRYREKLKEWEEKGWRIDSVTVARNRNKVAYAIPSPGRRKQKGWVLDAVPLLPAASASSARARSIGR